MRMLMINVLLPHTSFVIYNLDEDEIQDMCAAIISNGICIYVNLLREIIFLPAYFV